MNEPNRIPPLLIGKSLSDLIAEHNHRVERGWLTVGSRCRPADAKRVARAMATLSELQMPEGAVEASFGLRSDGSSPTCLRNDYVETRRS